MNRAIDLGFEYKMMKRLNYVDLQYLIIDHDVKALENQFRQLEKQRQAQHGFVVRDATNEEILQMHRK